LTQEEKQQKEAKKQCENDAISGELERIQRTLKMVNDEEGAHPMTLAQNENIDASNRSSTQHDQIPASEHSS